MFKRRPGKAASLSSCDMNEILPRRRRLRILSFLIAALFLTSSWSCLRLYSFQFESVFLGWRSPDAKMGIFKNETSAMVPVTRLYPPVSKTDAKTKGLGVSSSITIVSLPTRADRRRDMDTLRISLGVPESEWNYTDAVASADKRVLPVLEWVQYVRSTFVVVKPPNFPKYSFSWPDENEIDRLVEADVALDLWDTYPWASPFKTDFGSGSLSGSPPFVPCMTKDFTLPLSRNIEGGTAIPPHKILTSARVACWYSHLEAIQRIANSPVQQLEETAIILEDDVDMESDISEQLGLLWANLPRHWDIVFLGHCWSNESYHPPTHLHPLHSLHPSHRPQCTHAYVLSRPGARRLLLHLRYPPFAFSRAIDQALAWLVESRRIKAFSIVPSLVVQRKVRESDISRRKGGKGSNWKEVLRKGILETILGLGKDR